MQKNAHPALPRRALIGRFWATGRGFWLEETKVTAWALTIGLIAIVLIQLYVQYRLNIWNRDLFNGIEKKDGDAVLVQAFVFVPLALATIGLAVIAVYGRMSKCRRVVRRAFIGASNKSRLSKIKEDVHASVYANPFPSLTGFAPRN